ncbi:MAG: hypothetical protein AAFU85_30550, partial [Planctomycetota bacterium]
EGFGVSTTRDGSLRIEGIPASEVERLWAWASETETAIRNLEPAVNSLEQVFFDAAGAEDGTEAFRTLSES